MKHSVVIIAAVAFSLAAALPARADLPPIQIGDSASGIIASRGTPARIIETGDGLILFYGSTLVFVSDGVVGFVSVGNYGFTSPPPPQPAALPPPLAAAPKTSAPFPWEIMLADSGGNTDQAQLRYQRLATRARRFALNKTFATLDRDFRRALPLALERSTDSALAVADSRGHALPTYGDSTWTPWYAVGVDLRTAILAE